MRKLVLGTVAAIALFAPGSSWADMAAAERWVDSEFQPSTLSRKKLPQTIRFDVMPP